MTKNSRIEIYIRSTGERPGVSKSLHRIIVSPPPKAWQSLPSRPSTLKDRRVGRVVRGVSSIILVLLFQSIATPLLLLNAYATRGQGLFKALRSPLSSFLLYL